MARAGMPVLNSGRSSRSRPGTKNTLGKSVARKPSLYYKGVGRFHVHGSRGITIHRFEGVDEAEIRSWLYGIPLAALFHYGGFLVFHASVVEISGRGLVFAGDPGDGKSTTAAPFVSGGAKFIADDHAYLEVQGNCVKVRRGIAHGRLRYSALHLLNEELGVALREEPDEGKLAYAVRTDCLTKAIVIPVGGIYILTERSSVELELLNGRIL